MGSLLPADVTFSPCGPTPGSHFHHYGSPHPAPISTTVGLVGGPEIYVFLYFLHDFCLPAPVGLRFVMGPSMVFTMPVLTHLGDLSHETAHRGSASEP